MTSIAAIVCAHTLDRWDDIERAVASLQCQTRPADQVVLSVDNNAELAQAALAAFPNILVVHNTGLRGVSPTRNVAAEATACEVLAYLDDDAVADSRWIEQLLRWYADESVVGVGGTAHPAWDVAEPRWFPASFYWVVGCSHSGMSDEPAPVRNFIGCNMSIRRSAWQAVGGFDESIGRVGADGGGGDETDFCLRVSQAVGGVIMHDPAATVSHRVPQSRQSVGYFLKRCRSEGRSKAQIAANAGTDQALSEERKHVLGELPRSFVAGLSDTATGDLFGVARSAAIVLGTAATGLGYVTGTLTRSRQPAASSSALSANDDFLPVQVITVDLADPTQIVVTPDRPSFVIVRRDEQLLGTRRFDPTPDAHELRDQLDHEFPASGDPARTTISNAPRATAAVVIATRDRSAALQRCLTSLTTLTRIPDQVVVVDNAPTDGDTETLIDKWNETSALPVTYVLCERPGLATAHNAALPHVNTDIVAFTDDDVIADRYWLKHLVNGFHISDRVACVTGAIMPAEIETWPQDWVESNSKFTKGFATQLFSADTPPDDPLFPFTAGSMGSGANMAFATPWLVKNGGFDDALGAGAIALGGDDLRSFYDVIDSGHELFFTPDAIVFHHHHRTVQAIERQSFGYGVGLGAYLTSVVVDDPGALLKMLRRAPRAVRHAAQATASNTGVSYPQDGRRAWRQRFGIFCGPVRYFRSRN